MIYMGTNDSKKGIWKGIDAFKKDYTLMVKSL